MSIQSCSEPRYREMPLSVLGRSVVVATKPGIFSWDGLDTATALLIEAMQVQPTDRVLDLGCGYGIVGAAAAMASPQAGVDLVDENVVAVEAAQRTLALNGLTNAQVHLSDGTAAVRHIEFDVVAAHLPRGKEVAQQLIVQAAAALKMGGRLYLAGHNRSGIKPFLEFADQVVGPGQVLAYKKGCRVAVYVKQKAASTPDAEELWREVEVNLSGQTWRCAARPGVFARDGLDDGTRALIGAMDIRSGETVLDLGCGCGIVGAVAAQKAAAVYLVDSSLIAVEASQRTLALNGIVHAQAVLSDGAAAVRDTVFDVVVTNPPFHQERETDYSVAHQFIRDAAEVLSPRGRLYVVANRFIRYQPQMQACFGQVGTVYEDGRFYVILAQRPKK